jgi:hypothetical protein
MEIDVIEGLDARLLGHPRRFPHLDAVAIAQDG